MDIAKAILEFLNSNSEIFAERQAMVKRMPFTADQDIPVEMDDDYRNQYPEFTIVCDVCAGMKVYIENDMGWSPLSGGWGGLHLVCQDCGNRVTIHENW